MLSDGSTVGYDNLILATGATPRPLAIPGGDHPACLAIRTLEDATRLRPFMQAGRRIAVVGAGFIGLECAAAARGHGAEVVVLERAPRVLARGVTPRISALYADLHRAKGVDLRLGVDLLRIDGPANAPVLARAAGLAVDGGIVVDQHGRTADPAIWAAGDVTQHFNPLLGQRIRLESWQNAQNQAIAVAKNIAGIETVYAEVPWFWSDQYGINMQITGLPQDGAQEVVRGDLDGFAGLLFQMAGGRLIAAVGLNAARDLRFAKQIIQLGGAVSAAELADPAVKLADIAKRLKG